jgi:dTDP-glucose 4,6-dehydratase
VLDWIERIGESLVTLDNVTYSGNAENLGAIRQDARHTFVRGDVNDRALVRKLLAAHRPARDRPLRRREPRRPLDPRPGAFVPTNFGGTVSTAEAGVLG